MGALCLTTLLQLPAFTSKVRLEVVVSKCLCLVCYIVNSHSDWPAPFDYASCVHHDIRSLAEQL